MPEIGTTMTDGVVTRKILWSDGKRLHIRSCWLTKAGDEASHSFMLSVERWDKWVRDRNPKSVQ